MRRKNVHNPHAMLVQVYKFHRGRLALIVFPEMCATLFGRTETDGGTDRDVRTDGQTDGRTNGMQTYSSPVFTVGD